MTSVSRIASLATALLLTAGAGLAGAESASAPKASDVATLRQLLALQYPALRHASASSEASLPAPALTAEPDRGDAAEPTSQGGA